MTETKEALYPRADLGFWVQDIEGHTGRVIFACIPGGDDGLEGALLKDNVIVHACNKWRSLVEQRDAHVSLPNLFGWTAFVILDGEPIPKAENDVSYAIPTVYDHYSTTRYILACDTLHKISYLVRPVLGWNKESYICG